MKRLAGKVNIVPIIAKADSLTALEMATLKKKVLKEFEEHGIAIFKIPECDSDEDELYRIKDREIRESIPFAIVGSTTSIDMPGSGRRIRGREYAWGLVDIQDERYSDFIKLRTFLSLHMQDLKDATNDVLYENYRTGYLAKMSSSGMGGMGGGPHHHRGVGPSEYVSPVAAIFSHDNNPTSPSRLYPILI